MANQGITGFLKLTGAVKSNGTADQVQYWEETRLHPAQVATPAATADVAATTMTLNMAVNTQKPLRVNDVILGWWSRPLHRYCCCWWR